MKSEDVVRQLMAVLPKYTDFFTEKVSISSLTYSGGNVTAQTAAVHGVSVGDYISVQNALIPLQITSLTRIGNTATGTTAVAHDLTGGINKIVNISNADQTEYNGDQSVLTVPTNKTFTFKVSGTPATPATGTIVASENYLFGFNGRFAVASVPDTTTFTYALSNAPKANTASGTSIEMIKDYRITPVGADEAIGDAYTKQDPDNYWIFVSLGETAASRSRDNSYGDSIAEYKPGIDYRPSLYQNLKIFVVAPTKTSITARIARDSMEDVRVALFKSLLGVKFDTEFTIKDTYGLVFAGDDIEVYNKAYYVHNFQFQLSYSLVSADIVDPDDSVAFRNFEIKYNRSDDYTLKDDQGELP